ncbi:hypothetical protein EMIHUDRAFT_461601 [Emiliania huxleyi CCMP1516]|uniref:CNNM transmembrane domain-containing protein n=2 Tax=Emiliania huxleyi TaxID=2903 RepID=A0A0D3IU50_EMIH1|nr:hypothetical protein EMIHUDRAFT_461601 [Emiliania huxleyi CCMP1516]EOD14785.1 hypothetical protein EMIHUDRAFT_461601 [Emiliania huxleyi CCMP1516]|eukprot:XP_005767214.1 hypothetical protein EMIHUDRAFT_461601 [Emiliania huxleyi CCMP1516]
MPDVGLILASVALVGLSACFSGLTLGLLSLSLESLELIVSGGSAREAAWARKIYPMRRHGNLLLCTLLLGNTLVNVLISIFSAQFLSPGLGAIMASLVIVVFGEIIPQSVCSRHGLRIGAASRPLVVPLMFAFLPVTWPIARLLDFALGSEMRTMYNKRQLDRLLDINAAADDRKLLSSALAFSEKRLTFDVMRAVYESGFTRVPVYHVRRSTVVGLVFTKVAALLALLLDIAHEDTRMLDKMLQQVQLSRAHMWLVTRSAAALPAAAGGGANGGCGGGALMPAAQPRRGVEQDILEELIQDEIVDESDVVADSGNKALQQRTPQRRAPSPRGAAARIEFFEMLQRRDGLALGRALGPAAKTADEVRALVSYLSTNVSLFRPAAFSGAALRRLVQRCPIYTVSAQQVAHGHYIYVRGVPASCCCLLLHGRVQVCAGNEGLVSDIGPWTLLAANALTEERHVPDFTARVAAAARIFTIPRAELLAV